MHRIEDGTGSVKYTICEKECECKPHILLPHSLLLKNQKSKILCAHFNLIFLCASFVGLGKNK